MKIEKMKPEKIAEIAKNEGFEAAILSPNDLEFDFTYRKYCKENLCGNYAQSGYCPPLCKDAEELKNEVLKHKFVLVLKSSHKISDLSDREKIKAAGQAHNAATLRLLSRFQNFGGALAFCTSCDVWAPPNSTAACLSAYCVNVAAMAEKCNLTYAYKDPTLPLFGFITLD